MKFRGEIQSRTVRKKMKSFAMTMKAKAELCSIFRSRLTEKMKLFICFSLLPISSILSFHHFSFIYLTFRAEEV